jgi:hypothetical protein
MKGNSCKNSLNYYFYHLKWKIYNYFANTIMAKLLIEHLISGKMKDISTYYF